MTTRTDLAAERLAQLEKDGAPPPGARTHRRAVGEAEFVTVEVTDDEASRALGKPLGRYVTASFPSFGSAGETPPEEIEALAAEIAPLLPPGLCLVVGLGNADITPDAFGPQVIGQLFPTRHLPENLAIPGFEDLRPVAAIAPGVLGQTGMEAGEIVAALAGRMQPAVVVAIDALAASDFAWLGRTVQLTDTGISPGSGVQNRRKELSAATLGVPVVAIGVPTVADIAPLGVSDEPLMVTPRDIDRLVHRAAALVALALDRALQPTLSLEELALLVN